ISKTRLVSIKEKERTETGDNIGIIEKEKLGERITQLQDKKERLEKEIAEKEKVIRQKVLKHIFNNYSEISKELGGNVFLGSVIGDKGWQEISKEFIN